MVMRAALYTGLEGEEGGREVGKEKEGRRGRRKGEGGRGKVRNGRKK